MTVMMVAALAGALIGTGADEPDEPLLTVFVHPDDPPTRLSRADLDALPRRSVEIKDEEEGTATYEGVPLHEILIGAWMPMGEKLRGPAMTFGLVVEASDRYRVLFSLAELDPGYTNDRLILLADRKDGRPIAPPEGPLRLIIPTEPRRSRWIRMVEVLTLHSADIPPPSPPRASP